MLAACLLYACSEKANEIEIPGSVERAFADRFPGVTGVDWSQENDSEFEAEFKDNGKEQSANFSIGGVWKSTEAKVMEADVPSIVLSSISSEFSRYKIKGIESIETP